VPSPQSFFGADPWMENPTGVAPNGTTYSYNWYYFATAEAAAKIARMVGGKVVEKNHFTPTGGMFQQSQPNYMVELPDGATHSPANRPPVVIHRTPICRARRDGGDPRTAAGLPTTVETPSGCFQDAPATYDGAGDLNAPDPLHPRRSSAC
jgi:hypothetical protein